MKKLYFILFMSIVTFDSFAQSTILNQNFESISASGEAIAGWEFSNAQTWFLAGYGHNSDKYAGWAESNNSDHWIKTPMVNNPGTLIFWIAAYNDASNLGVKVQVSSNGTEWIDQDTFISKGAGGDFGLTFLEKTVVIQLTGSYYIRWTTVNHVDGGFYLDDITLNDIIPVELTSFTASVIDNQVKLKWSTSTEKNNSGFEIQRNTQGSTFIKIGFIQGEGTTTEHQNYTYIDNNLNDGQYTYRLKQIDFDGTFEYSSEVEVIVNALVFSLEQNYPNPFNPNTKIKYQIPQERKVVIRIFDVLGNEVFSRTEERTAGHYEINFDASSLSSGIYVYKLQAGDFIDTKKMLLLK